MTIALLAIMLVPLLVKERDQPPPPREPVLAILREIPRAFGNRAALLAALVMTWMNLAAGMVLPVAGVLFMQHLGWKQEEYSEITGGPGLIIGFIGSLSAGFLADVLGRRKARRDRMPRDGRRLADVRAQRAAVDERTFVYTLFVLEPLSNSVLTVSLWALCMDTSDPKVGATQFAVYTSLTNLSTVLGAKLLGANALTWWSFRQTYIVAAMLQLVIVLLLPLIRPRKPAP